MQNGHLGLLRVFMRSTGNDHMIHHSCLQLPTHQKQWEAAAKCAYTAALWQPRLVMIY